MTMNEWMRQGRSGGVFDEPCAMKKMHIGELILWMELAVDDENYELAARYRDEIRSRD